MSKQEKLILFYVGLFCLTIITLSLIWKTNPYYSNAYTPIVEQSNKNKAIEAQNQKTAAQGGRQAKSNQPQAAGFRESDIEKNRGDRYSTY